MNPALAPGADNVAPIAEHGGSHDHHHDPHLAHHFETPAQQFEACKLGMWIFLATEILFFSGLFCAYAVYRSNHPEIFAFADHFLDRNLGALNTVVLLFSSLTMAWAVRCAQVRQPGLLKIMLIITLLCAFIFLGIKGVEYHHKWHDGLLWGEHYNPSVHALEEVHELGVVSPRNVQIFFGIYFCMTGLHAIHIIIGIGAIGWLLKRAYAGEFADGYATPVDLVGLYWHLVDLIWIYLFPLLYLIH